MTAEASLPRTMPAQEALIRFQELTPAHQRLIFRYAVQQVRAPKHEQIRRAERRRVADEWRILKEELQRALLNGPVSDEKLTQLKRRWRRLRGSTKEKKPRANNTTSAPQNERAIPARPDTGNKHNALARALVQLAERREAKREIKEEAKGNKPWRNVPQFHAEWKERLRHRPAKAKNDRVRAYRRRLIRQTQSAPQPPAPPLSQSTTTVRFKERQSSDVQIFDLGLPATSTSKWVEDKAELTLTAAEKKFVHEDDWRQVRPNSRHSAKATCPTAQQVQEAALLASEPQQPSAQSSQKSSTKLQEIVAVARRLAHEERQRKAAMKRSEQARQKARDDDRLNAALPAVLKARREARAKRTAIKIMNEARRVEAEKKQKKRWLQ